MSVPILVLGARVAGGEPTSVLAARLDRALELWEGQRIIVSGRGEAPAMAAYLRKRGVPAELIVEESRATSTNENLENARALDAAPHFDVVTSDFHCLRTKLWSWHLGIPVRLHAALTPRRDRPYHYVRELVATPHSALRIAWRRWRARGMRG
ncbi:YdcF family protein [Corynebacterium sp.]|uniref:YdcF family protein n=1 Tax=Corynebacterium sp. TaxID=1720 RepID=UPI0026DB861E|nr:YdcF family protein [Corynebacterium sp.]MDO5031130.1 YdcF family protein [Corynebacterium sp.]